MGQSEKRVLRRPPETGGPLFLSVDPVAVGGAGRRR